MGVETLKENMATEHNSCPFTPGLEYFPFITIKPELHACVVVYFLVWATAPHRGVTLCVFLLPWLHGRHQRFVYELDTRKQQHSKPDFSFLRRQRGLIVIPIILTCLVTTCLYRL